MHRNSLGGAGGCSRFSQGADPALEDAQGRTALHLAAREGHAGAVFELAGAGAVDARDQWDGTALQASAARGHEECTRILLAHQVQHALTRPFRNSDGVRS